MTAEVQQRERESTQDLDLRAVELRRRHLTYQQIARELGLGHPTAAYHAVRRGLAQFPSENAQEVRRQETERLDELARYAMRILTTQHIMVSQGRVMRNPDTGAPLTDPGPALQAIDRLLKIQDRRARLHGLDAPVRAKVEVHDGIDAEIERLVSQLAGLAGIRQETAPAAPAGRGVLPSGTTSAVVAGKSEK